MHGKLKWLFNSLCFVVTGCQVADIAFVLDSSGSVQEDGDNWSQMKLFAQRLLDYMDIGSTKVLIGAVTYGSEAYVAFRLKDYSRESEISRQLGNLTFIGTKTNTAAGIQYMRNYIFQSQEGDRDYAPNIGILITDAAANIAANQVKPQADMAKDAGIHMVAIGITSKINPTELQNVATNEQSVFTAPDFNTLSNQITDIIRVICPDPTEEPRKGRTNQLLVIHHLFLF